MITPRQALRQQLVQQHDASDHAISAYAPESRESVITRGHTAHASGPACKNQRHEERMLHRGNAAFEGTVSVPRCASRTLSITPQRLPVHWPQCPSTHCWAKRNRLSGGRPWQAFLTNSVLIGLCGVIKPTTPSAPTTPKRMAPVSQQALGHRRWPSCVGLLAAVLGDSSILTRSLIGQDPSQCPVFARVHG